MMALAVYRWHETNFGAISSKRLLFSLVIVEINIVKESVSQRRCFCLLAKYKQSAV